jgi:hypothetical protein
LFDSNNNKLRYHFLFKSMNKYLQGCGSSRWFLDRRTASILSVSDDDGTSMMAASQKIRVHPDSHKPLSTDAKGDRYDHKGDSSTSTVPLIILTVPHGVPSELSTSGHWSDTEALTMAYSIKTKLENDLRSGAEIVLLPGNVNRGHADLNRYLRPGNPGNPEWIAWHDKLDSIIHTAVRERRHIILLDIHSYPGESTGLYPKSLGYIILGPWNKFGQFLNDKLWKAQPYVPGGENAIMLMASGWGIKDMALIEVNESLVSRNETADYISTFSASAIKQWLDNVPTDGEQERFKRVQWIDSLDSTVEFKVQPFEDRVKSVPTNYDKELEYRIDQCARDRSPETILYTTFSVEGSTLVVIRDDLLCGGAKSRYLPYVLRDPALSNYREFIYASGWPGGAQASLAASVKWLNKTRPRDDQLLATIFTEPDQDDPSMIPQKPFPLLAQKTLDAQYKLVLKEQDMATSIEGYIRKDETNRRKLLESGFPSRIERLVIRRMAESVRDHFQGLFTPKTRDFKFDEVWVCVGSALFIHGLAQVSDLAKEFIGVSVYQNATYPHMENVRIEYAEKDVFTPINPSTEIPLVPSSINYDAKVWTKLRTTFDRSKPKHVLWLNMF